MKAALLDGILADILANPDEDTPRLAYADALEEEAGGDCDRAEFNRAEFIRVQIAQARLPTRRLIPLQHKLRAVGLRHATRDLGRQVRRLRPGTARRRSRHRHLPIHDRLESLVRRAPVREVRLLSLPTIGWEGLPGAPGRFRPHIGRTVASLEMCPRALRGGVPADQWLGARMLLKHGWPGIRFRLPDHPLYPQDDDPQI